MAEPVLDITTLVEPVHVRIDGAPHRLLHPDAMTLEQTIHMEDLGPRVQELFTKLRDKTIDDAGRVELDDVLDRAVRLVLDAPDVVHLRLGQRQRFDVIKAFMGLSDRSAAEVTEAAAPTPTTPLIGASSSPDSPASIPARPSMGG